jgi:hypothetical protein
MRTTQQTIRRQRFCAWVLIFLGALSLFLFGVAFRHARWLHGVGLLFGGFFFITVGRLVIIGTSRRLGFHGGAGGSGESGAGKLVPVHPTPPHHLQAAKGLPPSAKTHSLQKD